MFSLYGLYKILLMCLIFLASSNNLFGCSVVPNPASGSYSGIVGVTNFSETINLSGGGISASNTLAASGLPPGLQLYIGDNSFTISGIATLPGTYTYTITIIDQNQCQSTGSYTFTITCPPISLSSTLPSGTINTPYNQTITVTGGTTPYIFSVCGTLPPGLSLDQTSGILSGTPSVVGSYTFTVTVTDTYGCTVNQSDTLPINS